jgi:hypothetical protein
LRKADKGDDGENCKTRNFIIFTRRQISFYFFSYMDWVFGHVPVEKLSLKILSGIFAGLSMGFGLVTAFIEHLQNVTKND